ncbi:MAG: NnrS family protein [Deltaproteobacteria bacterium]|nr:NnrS family protein [Deltaproteobacteria bacterium]
MPKKKSWDGGAAPLAVRLSHPGWLVDKWTGEFGEEEAESLLKSMLEEPPAVIRAHGASRDELAKILSTEGVAAEPTKWSRDGLRVESLEKAIAAKAFADGRFTIQGEASQLVADLLDARPGQRALDVCAAPGGKATHLAARVGPGGQVVALDRNERRLRLVQRNAERLHLENMRLVAADAEKPIEINGERFDRVLADVPCTGLGQLRRHPEAKWLVEPSDPARLAIAQSAILRNAAACVRPGGRLVYSTCTLTNEENFAVIEKFLSGAPDFSRLDAAEILGPERAALTRDGYMLCLPHYHGTEGFFSPRCSNANRSEPMAQTRIGPPPYRIPLLRTGFRPFFFLAAVFAAVSVPLWLLAYRGAFRVGVYFDPVVWHSHEMVFGYTGAVITGFLLTAVRNWTSGRETARGPLLAALALLWLAARLAVIFAAYVPKMLIAVLDAPFFFVAAVVIARPIVAAKTNRTQVFPSYCSSWDARRS